MQTYHSSIDWHHELGRSLAWLAGAWAISAVVLLIAGAALIRWTTRGRQFWAITGPFFTGPTRVRVWGVLAVLLGSVMVEVRLEVLQSYYSNDLFSALQTAFQGAGARDEALRSAGIHGFWMAIVVFCVLAVIKLARILGDTYLTQRGILAWRTWLTGRLMTDWCDHESYYRERFTAAPADNPDQRIQQDVDVFTTGVGTGPNTPSYYSTSTLVFGAVRSVVAVASFAVILWHLAGPLDLLGVRIPKALFWIVLAYVLGATVVADRIGRPLIGLSYLNEKTNAAFRYALVRLRDGAESVALYRGAPAERTVLDGRFAAVVANYRRYVRRTLALMGWNFTITQVILPLPFVLQAPRLFAGTIRLGDVTQSATAFGRIESGLSFFRNAYPQFASYEAAIIRLYGLVQANQGARALPALATAISPDGAVEMHAVGVATPAGRTLVESLDLRLEPGDSLVITGPSGSGKTSLIRSLAELWPSAQGSWQTGASTMFTSQRPYVPAGDLRMVLSYPAPERTVADDGLRDVLRRVSLAHLTGRLDEETDWATTLSPGEQQRIGFARVLLARPGVVFLDEASSALDDGLEHEMYRLLRAELPDAVVISVAHRASVLTHHRRRLALLGDGRWRLDDVRPERGPEPGREHDGDSAQ